MKKFAFVFPGQGSQSVGMLDGWGDHPAVRDVVAEASQALSQDIAKLIREGSKEDLTLTTNTQPIMLVAGVAAYRAWVYEGGMEPAFVAGHSLGEYSALVVAGAMSLLDALPLVRFRAEAMQRATPVGSGAMAAILGLPSEVVRSVCAKVQADFEVGGGEIVEAVNFNDITQTVIAGTKLAVEKACVELRVIGAKRALLLPVSAPFHSSLMLPAAVELRDRLETLSVQSPKIALLNNVDVLVEDDPKKIKDALYRQAFMPVRWVEVIQSLANSGVSSIIECGPGRVLSAMSKRIVPTLVSESIYDLTTLAEVKFINLT